MLSSKTHSASIAAELNGVVVRKRPPVKATHIRWSESGALTGDGSGCGCSHGNRVNQSREKSEEEGRWCWEGNKQGEEEAADAVWCCRQLQTAFYLSLSDSCFQSTREAQSPAAPTPHYLYQAVISCCVWVCVCKEKPLQQTAPVSSSYLEQHTVHMAAYSLL